MLELIVVESVVIIKLLFRTLVGMLELLAENVGTATDFEFRTLVGMLEHTPHLVPPRLVVSFEPL